MAINSFPPAGGAGGYEFPSELIDPVSKFRVSQPENLIDTDFEYGLQPTKWETVELINNTPSFFSKSGDTTIDGISSIITNAGTREIIVKTELDHGLAVGIPINVTGTKSITADGSYIINSIPDTKTFTYLCKDDQTDTASILDLYSSIITGEFFQGSQLRVSDSEGIVTDAEGTSELTVTTNSTHGFGVNTPFYFLNLNSTVAQEFQAANTASKTFDASNSATAQTFDGSNTLSSFNVDWSNSAVDGGTVSNISSVDLVNGTVTVSHTSENFVGRPLGTALYYDVSASSGFFQTNPRGIVFLKTTTALGTSSSTFQVSLVPDGDALPITTTLSGTFQIANQARTFAGNNINPITQTSFEVEIGELFEFDGGNQGFVGDPLGTPVNSTLTITGVNTTAIVATGSAAADYYVGAMVLYSTTGTAITGLTDDETYFVKTVTHDGSGTYTLSISGLPTTAAISVSGFSGTHTLSKIGISTTKDIFHIKDSNFTKDDMLQYFFPEDGRFDVESVDQEKLFYFVEEAYDQHNYKLKEKIAFSPILATGGNSESLSYQDGVFYKTHTFSTTGTSNFVVSALASAPEGNEVEYLVIGGGGGGGNTMGGGGGGGGFRTGTITLSETGSISVTVGQGGTGAPNREVSGTNGGNSVFGTVTAIGGGGGASWSVNAPPGNGGSGGGGCQGHSTSAFGSGTAGPPRQGFNGSPVWSSCGSYNRGGGGGGAGGAATTTDGAPGLTSNITGTSLFYSAGGGGGANGCNSSGGSGIGGFGTSNGSRGGDGAANRGAGGGAGGYAPDGPGGNGGSGVVIVRYALTVQDESLALPTGGTISSATENNKFYAVHTFTSTGTFSALQGLPDASNSEIEYLIVGGGGGGGNTMGGGGGGGGVLFGTLSAIDQDYPVVVGQGGIGAPNRNVSGTNGGNSSFAGLTAIGGGGGASWNAAAPTIGGSGGGGSEGSGSVAGSGTAGPPRQGFNGAARGVFCGSYFQGGGGGGAGAQPGNADGGIGITRSISGSSLFYAAGGGGGGNTCTSAGGSGIGGNGASGSSGGSAGTNGRGAGGGGGGYGPGDGPGGNGGTGVVIIRYVIVDNGG
jgi:hypothetical protein